MSDIGTHYEGCEQYHLECAKHALADRDRRIEALTKAHAALLDQAVAYLAEVKHCTSLAEARRLASAGLKALASAAGADGGGE